MDLMDLIKATLKDKCLKCFSSCSRSELCFVNKTRNPPLPFTVSYYTLNQTHTFALPVHNSSTHLA